MLRVINAKTFDYNTVSTYAILLGGVPINWHQLRMHSSRIPFWYLRSFSSLSHLTLGHCWSFDPLLSRQDVIQMCRDTSCGSASFGSWHPVNATGWRRGTSMHFSRC